MQIRLSKGIQGIYGLTKGSYVSILGVNHGGAEYGYQVFVSLNVSGKAMGFHLKNKNRASDPVVRLHHNFGKGYIEFPHSEKFSNLVSPCETVTEAWG